MAFKVRMDFRKLKRFPKKFDKAIKRGLTKGAFEVERKAKQYSPVDTGALRRSIRTDKVHKIPTGWSVNVSPHVPYAERIERPGNVRGVGRRPFMFPALKNSATKIVHHLINEIRRIR